MKPVKFYRLIALTIFLVTCGFASHEAFAADAGGKPPVVYMLDLDRNVNAAIADFIVQGIETAEQAGAAALVIRMDTPGGLVSVTKKIVKSMENAKIPVIVYVAPSGSSAASAGALITVAADIAAMAPGTNIGAAHPVGAGGQGIEPVMEEKVMNDLSSYMRGIVAEKGRNAEWVEKAIRKSVSVTAKEALDLKVIDVVAVSVPELLDAVDGKQITKDNHVITLHTKGARIERILPSLRFKILDVIADPNVLYGLLMIGILGIGVEITHPGLILPGVAGGISILLFAFASQILPVNYVGVLLILLAIFLFIVELKVPSYGAVGIGAVISFVLGSIMLFDYGETGMRVSYGIIIPATVLVSLFFLVAVSLVVKARLSKPRTGQQGLVGEVGIATTELDTEGKVEIHGEYWNAKSDRQIAKGERVRVVKVDSLYLLVTRDLAG
jgi:membrane-bound serine protease (ClpP class)